MSLRDSTDPVGRSRHDEGGQLQRWGQASLRVLLVLALGWVLLELARRLAIVVVPVCVGLLFTALLRPLVNRGARGGLSRGAATLLVVLGFWAVLAALGYLVAVRASGQLPRLLDEAATTVDQLRRALVGGPLDIAGLQVDSLSNRAIAFIQDHRDVLTTRALTGVRALIDALTGILLAVFVGIYLMYDGTQVWSWGLDQLAPARSRRRLDVAGHAAYAALSGYLRGQLAVAVFHGTVVAVVLLVLHVPLALPLALLVALGSLVPIAGALIAGGLAALVTLLTQGLLPGVLVVLLLVVDSQVEAHVLQPFVVGRSVELHPLAVVLALATGTVVAGIWGALFAVPLVAAFNAGRNAWQQQEPAGSGSPRRRPARRP